MQNRMKNQLISTIKALEVALLQPEVRKSKRRLNELLADGFFEFGASGNRWTKKDTLNDLPTLVEVKYTMHDFDIIELSSDVVLATYRIEKKVRGSGKKTTSLRSSIWKKRNGKWQMVFHQGTPQTPQRMP